MGAEDEVYELRLQLARTQVQLHEADAARHAAEKELQRLRLPAAQHQADAREREVLSLRSMLRSALDENAKLQAQLGVANRRLAELSSQPPVVQQQQQQGRGSMLASHAWEEPSELPPANNRAVLSEDTRAVRARLEQAPQQLQPQCSALGVAGGELKAACHQPNSILLLKAKLEQVAAAAAAVEGEEQAGCVLGCVSSQAPPAVLQQAPGQAHTSTSFSAVQWPQQGEARPAHQPGLRQIASDQQLPPQQLPPAVPAPLPELQQVYQEIRALQERLKAAEARFGAAAPISRPGSPGSGALSPPRSRPLSPSHGPDPDWRLIHQLRQRKARAESMQLAASRAALAAAVVAGPDVRQHSAAQHHQLPFGECLPTSRRAASRSTGDQLNGSGMRSNMNLNERTPGTSWQGGWVPPSRTHGAIRDRRRSASAERGVSSLPEPTPTTDRRARRRSRSQQEEISRLLMAGMSTSKNGRSRQESRSSRGAWVTPVMVGL